MELRHVFSTLLLLLLLITTRCQCADPSCRMNCSTDNDCWRAALIYRSFELVEKLFSFGSLSIHVSTFQQEHSDELNDSLLLIDTALEKHLINQATENNLTINLFKGTKQILLDFCRNLTSSPVETLESLPSLICSSSTCMNDTSEWTVMFVLVVLILVCVLVVFTVQIALTYRFRMYWLPGVGVLWIGLILGVGGRRDVFESKCKRHCSTQTGSIDCWRTTTDGFAYGLSAAMVDFCHTILKIRELGDPSVSWYGISRDILSEEIRRYDLEDGVQQLTKENIGEIARTLLDQCFNATTAPPSFEPTCASCTESQDKLIRQWRLLCIILISVACLVVLLTFLSYTLHEYYIRHSYVSM